MEGKLMRFLIRYYEGILRLVITRWREQKKKRKRRNRKIKRFPPFIPRRPSSRLQRDTKDGEIGGDPRPGNSSISGRAPPATRPQPSSDCTCVQPLPNRRKVCIHWNFDDEQLLRRRPLARLTDYAIEGKGLRV